MHRLIKLTYEVTTHHQSNHQNTELKTRIYWWYITKKKFCKFHSKKKLNVIILKKKKNSCKNIYMFWVKLCENSLSIYWLLDIDYWLLIEYGEPVSKETFDFFYCFYYFFCIILERCIRKWWRRNMASHWKSQPESEGERRLVH